MKRHLLIGLLAVIAVSAAPAVADELKAVPVATPSATPAPSPSPTASPGPLDALAWRGVGPAVGGGRLAAIAGSDTDPALVYIGAAGGGVWKSTNQMTSWQPVFDKQHVGSIGAIAIAAGDTNDVWVGTGEGNPRNDVSYGDGIYRTRDGGKTWKRLGLEHSYAISKIELDPRNPNVAVVAALGDPFRDSDDRGIYRTTDGGITWTKTLALGPMTGGADLARSTKSPDTLFAAMWQFRRSSWHLTSGGDADGLFKSTDGGGTWKRVQGNGFLTGITGRIGVAVAPSDPNRVYAVIESQQGVVWRSSDAGASWELVSQNTLVDERPFYYSRLFVDPTNADHLFATSVLLAESTTGGKAWKRSGRRLHGDHHVMWMAADGKRMLEGNDGGPAISRDNGATWEWRNNVPIEQAYRVAVDHRTPYTICTGLQDNGAWCGPTNSHSGAGNLGYDWIRAGSGDGNWTVPDPVDPDWVWSSSGGGDNGGSLTRFNQRTRLSLDVSPYLRNQNVVAPAELKYRLNWEAPVAFSPFDGHLAFYGGDVVFATHDAGMHWLPISPDLTRNIKSRQVLSGTPLRLDVTGAETYDTILDIAPSPAADGTIWVSTDDGVVQVTRDGGKHWTNVTPPGADPDTRIPTIEASHAHAGTAYAVMDRHFIGDRTPLVVATDDFGKTWHSIASGLPADQNARAICEDPVNPNLLFLGLENSIWFSEDRGRSWQSLQGKLPPTSIRDLRIADGHDLIVATHGRGIYILDDISALEHPANGTTLLYAPKTAYQFEDYTPTVNSLAAGQNPPLAAITFALAHAAKTAPEIEISDASGTVVRHFRGMHDDDGEDEPVVSNVAGLNRITWDLSGDEPVPWSRAPMWNRNLERGADLLPGTYRITLIVDGARVMQPMTIAPDPRAAQTPAQRRAHVAWLKRLVDAFSRVDVALNTLDNVQLQLPGRIGAMQKTGATAASIAQAQAVLDEANREAAQLSSHPKNSQDNDFLRDMLRERLQSLIFQTSALAPTGEQDRESRALIAEIDRALAAHQTYLRTAIPAIEAALTQAKFAPLDLNAKPPKTKIDDTVDQNARRADDDQ